MIQQKLREGLKQAMIDKDETKLNAIRGLLSAFTNELVALKRKPTDELTPDEELAVVKRAVKQRKDSIEQFRAGGREDLVTSEEAELAFITPLLPQAASRDEIRKVAEAKKAELGVSDKSKMGILMGAVMKEMKGTADGADVKAVVEELLS